MMVMAGIVMASLGGGVLLGVGIAWLGIRFGGIKIDETRWPGENQ